MSLGLPVKSDAPQPLAPSYPPPPAPGRGAVSAPPEFDWRNYLESARRHKRFMWAAVAFGIVLGVVVARLLPSTYQTEVNFWVEVPKSADSKDPGPTWSNQVLGSAGWIDLLRSDVILSYAVREQRLYLNPAKPQDVPLLAGFTTKSDTYQPGLYRLAVDRTGRQWRLTDKAGRTSLRGAVGDSIGADLGFAWQPAAGALPPGRVIEFEVVPMKEASEQLDKALLVRPGREKSFIHLELHGRHPRAIAATLNSMAERLVSLAGDFKRQKLTTLVQILGDQLQRSQASLDAAEAELKEFRTRTATQRVQESDPHSLGYLTMSVDRDQLRADREAITHALGQPDAESTVRTLQTIGAVQRSPELVRAMQDLLARDAELSALRRQYTDQHPAVQQLSAEVETLRRGTIPSLARALVHDLDTQAASLARRLDETSADLRAISPISVEDARLARNVKVAEEMFMNLRERYEEARLAEMSITPDVRLLDAAAVPKQPLYRRGALALMLSMLATTLLGLAGVVIYDLVDRKVRYPVQVSRDLGLPLLGVIPHVPRGDGRDLAAIAPVIEALRGVRLNVLNAVGATGTQGDPVVFTVTSPGMGEGKSLVTSNLALAFADAGYRTLLIDGDIRRGMLQRTLNTLRKPGLTDYLEGEFTAEEVIQATDYNGLHFIGSGSRRRSGPELLSSTAMTRFVADLRRSFDVILIDSSPLAAGIDSYALASITGNLLVVLRVGVSDRHLAASKLDIMRRLPVRIIGSVVNDVRPMAEYKDYSYYLAGYELEEEATAESGVGAGRRILPARTMATTAAGHES